MKKTIIFVVGFLVFLTPVLSFAHAPVVDEDIDAWFQETQEIQENEGIYVYTSAEEERNVNVQVNLHDDESSSTLIIEGERRGNDVTVFVDGEQATMSEIARGAFRLLNSVLWLALFVALLGFLIFIFWLAQLVHAFASPIRLKWLWVIVIIVFSFLGALVYLFAVRLRFKKRQPYMQTAPPANLPQ